MPQFCLQVKVQRHNMCESAAEVRMSTLEVCWCLLAAISKSIWHRTGTSQPQVCLQGCNKVPHMHTETDKSTAHRSRHSS
jgi:hypothetical protein